jgi:hypothetical protein
MAGETLSDIRQHFGGAPPRPGDGTLGRCAAHSRRQTA